MMIGPSCEELARRSTSDDMENASLMTRLLVRIHMTICTHCIKFASQMKLISEAARRRLGAEPDPVRLTALKKRLLNDLS